MCAAAFALLTRVDDEAAYAAQVFPAVLLLGIGLAIAVAPLTATVLASVPPEHAGTASGINNAAARVAGLLAIAALGGLAASQFAGRVDQLAAGAPAPVRAELLAGREAPFVTSPTSVTPVSARAETTRALASASVHAYRVTMATGAILAALAGIVALVGLTARHAAPADEAARSRAAA